MHHQQWRRISSEGTYLGGRLYEGGDVRLYYFPAGFFVEEFFHHGAGMPVRYNTFTVGDGLAPYLDLIELPDGL